MLAGAAATALIRRRGSARAFRSGMTADRLAASSITRLSSFHQDQRLSSPVRLRVEFPALELYNRPSVVVGCVLRLTRTREEETRRPARENSGSQRKRGERNINKRTPRDLVTVVASNRPINEQVSAFGISATGMAGG